METEAFRRFRYSFFEDIMSVRDGLDTVAVQQLMGAEREQAVKLLIDFLPDARGVIGLGLLGAIEAEPRLVELLSRCLTQIELAKRRPGRNRPDRKAAYLAEALYRIRPDPRWAAVLAEILTTGDDWTNRMTAAIALVGVPDPAVVPPLVAALDDDIELVRYHAARALLAVHGLPYDVTDNDHATYQVMSEDAGRRGAGCAALLAAIEGRAIAPR